MKSFEVSLEKLMLDDDDDKDEISLSTALSNLLRNYVHSSLALFVETLVTFVSILYVGYLDDSTLISGWGLGIFTINVLVFAPGMGLCGGIDTLVSQAYGRKDYELCTTYLNTTRIVIWILFAGQCLILFNISNLMTLLGQPKEAIVICQQYVYIVAIGAFLNLQFEATRRFLCAIGILSIPANILTITFVFHTISLYFFVIYFNMSIVGVGIATNLTFLLNVVLIQLYIWYNGQIIVPKTYFFADQEAIKKLPEFLKYGIPASLMVIVMWTAYEFLSIIAGWIGVKELAACVILMQIFLLIAMSPIGLSYGSTNLIGNSLGQNKPKVARRYTQILIAFGSVSNILILLVVYLLKGRIIRIFTSDQEVAGILNNVLWFYLINWIFDFTQVMNLGPIRAMGNQKLATAIQTVCFWFISIPLACFFTFKLEYGFKGIWFGFPIGTSILACIFVSMNLLAPFEKIAKEASKNRKFVLSNSYALHDSYF